MAIESQSYIQNVKRFGLGVAVIMIGTLVGKISELLIQVFIARKFGPEAFGNFVLTLRIFQFLLLVCILEFTSATMHFGRIFIDEKDSGALRQLFIVTMGISCILATGMLVFIQLGGAALFCRLFKTFPHIDNLIRLIIWALPFAVIFSYFYNHLLILHRRFEVVLYRDIFGKFLKLIGVVVLAFFIQSIYGVIALYVFFYVVLGVFAFMWLVRNIAKKNTIGYNRMPEELIKRIYNFLWPLTLGGLSIALAMRLDVFSTAFFLKPYEVGLYAAAFVSSFFFTIPNYVLNEVFFPFASTLVHKKSTMELKILYQTAVRWLIIILLPIAIVLIMRAKIFITLLFGNIFLQATAPFIIIIIGHLVFTLAGPWPSLILANELTRISLRIRILRLIVGLALSILLIPKFGIIGAATALSMTLFIITFFRIYWLWRSTGLLPFTKRLSAYLFVMGCGGVILLSITRFIMPQNLFFYLFEIVLILLYACIVIFKIIGLTEDDKAFLVAVRDGVSNYIKR